MTRVGREESLVAYIQYPQEHLNESQVKANYKLRRSKTKEGKVCEICEDFDFGKFNFVSKVNIN